MKSLKNIDKKLKAFESFRKNNDELIKRIDRDDQTNKEQESQTPKINFQNIANEMKK